MVATFVAYEAATAWHLPFAAAIAVALAFSFLAGAALYRGVLHRAREGGEHAVVMVTIGLLMILEGAAGAIWGTDTKEFHHYFADAGSVEMVSGVFVSWHDLWIIAAATVLVILLALFFRFTRIGVTLRAVSQNAVAAQLMGVRVARVHALTWGLASVLAAVAGILIVPKVFLDPSMMFAPLLKAFAAAVLGGMRSVTGAVVGGWLLGLVEVMAGAYISTEFQASIAFVIIVVVLTLRPEGLLGRPEVKKV
jgi:branched-chain amino acid transport system permease protein